MYEAKKRKKKKKKMMTRNVKERELEKHCIITTDIPLFVLLGGSGPSCGMIRGGQQVGEYQERETSFIGTVNVQEPFFSFRFPLHHKYSGHYGTVSEIRWCVMRASANHVSVKYGRLFKLLSFKNPGPFLPAAHPSLLFALLDQSISPAYPA